MHDTAPAQRPSAGRQPDRTPLAQRRKEALRLEIAREAVRLFTTHGVTATTGDDIAQAVGISARTLWRHFPTKESCIRPVVGAGLEMAIDHLRNWPPDKALLDFLRESYRRDRLPPVDPAVLDLIRMTATEPGLRAAWLQAHDDALPVFAELLALRSGARPQDLRIQVHAATVNGALRAAVEHYARRFGDSDRPEDDLAACLDAALEAAAEGLPY